MGMENRRLARRLPHNLVFEKVLEILCNFDRSKEKLVLKALAQSKNVYSQSGRLFLHPTRVGTRTGVLQQYHRFHLGRQKR
jgi:hypothetical protein